MSLPFSRPALYPRAVWYFLAALALAIAGFFPSFFARLGATDAATMLHGLSAFAWLCLLALQAVLIRRGERRWHRALGRWSWLIVLPLVGAGLLMVRSMLSGSTPFQRTFGPMLAWHDLTTLLYFLTAYGLAIHWRRHLHLHARLMTSTALLVLPPALGRLLPALVPGIDSFMQTYHAGLLGAELATLALIVHDLRRWRLWPPYPVLLGYFVLLHVSIAWVGAQPAWLAFCRWIAAL
jgi:hypothetical protein